MPHRFGLIKAFVIQPNHCLSLLRQRKKFEKFTA